MPSWNVHLAIAKQVNKKLKLDKDSFYIGNLLPDVDYGMKKNRHETHYYGIKCPKCPEEILPNYKEFIKNNKDNLSNPIILGELVHIMTDYFYNKYIYQNYWIQTDNDEVIGIKLLNGKIIKFDKNDTSFRKEYKHRDLELYGKYLFNNDKIDIPQYNDNIKKFLISDIYTENDIEKRIDYLNTTYKDKNRYALKEKLFGIKYRMISKTDLDKVFKDCVVFIEKELREIL